MIDFWRMMLKKSQKQLVKSLSRRFSLDLLYLFGSVARGDEHATSDVDIAYQSTVTLTPIVESQLASSLADIFSGKRIDLVNLRNASPLLAHQILIEGKLLFGESKQADQFYRLTLKRFIDAKPLFEATRVYVQAHAV